MLPEVIDFRINKLCNMDCPFCFGTSAPHKLNMTLLENFFHDLAENGLKYVVLTGGEPTISPDFTSVVSLLRNLGLNIALQSNGFFWNNTELRKNILQSCRWLALPLESPVPSIHNKMRNSKSNHHQFICTILNEISQERQKYPSIKIGTVVCQENISTLPSFLESLPLLPDVWKLYQLSRSDTNRNYYEKYKISDVYFTELLSNLQCVYGSVRTRIYASREIDRDGRYLFLEPNGVLLTIKNGESFCIGNYSSPIQELIASIDDYVDVPMVNFNFRNSFICP